MTNMNTANYDDECEFKQRQPHEWYCVVHDVTKLAGTTEPVSCDYDLLIELPAITPA